MSGVILQPVLGGKPEEEIEQQELYGHRLECSVSIVVKKATGRRTTIKASQKKVDNHKVEDHGNLPSWLKRQHKQPKQAGLLTEAQVKTYAEIGKTLQPIQILAELRLAR